MVFYREEKRLVEIKNRMMEAGCWVLDGNFDG